MPQNKNKLYLCFLAKGEKLIVGLEMTNKEKKSKENVKNARKTHAKYQHF
jgi:hypothetical protein